VGDAKAGANVVSQHTAHRKERKALAGIYHRAGVALCDRR
jgi:hypothetical protein